jgi:glycosyltransferase involved in cell wall biosynthesis
VTTSVSVVLATYNGAAHLAGQLASLASQSLVPGELVVGDDGSTDATVGLVEEFARSAQFPVRLTVRSLRTGYADNFLAIARLASGSLLAFCDQDDVWHPDKLERVVAAFADSPGVVLVAHHADVVDHRGRPLGRPFPDTGLAGRYPPGGLPLAQYPGFALTVRRELLEVADPDRRPDQGDWRAGLMGHDAWLWLLASCTGESVILPDRLVSYRQHENLFGDSHVGFRERVRRARAADADTYVARAAGEAALVEYLETLSQAWAELARPDWASRALNRAARHRLLEARATERARLYDSPSRRAALARWAQMIRSGVYRSPGAAGTGGLSAAKDALRSVLRTSSPTSDGKRTPL